MVLSSNGGDSTAGQEMPQRARRSAREKNWPGEEVPGRALLLGKDFYDFERMMYIAARGRNVLHRKWERLV